VDRVSLFVVICITFISIFYSTCSRLDGPPAALSSGRQEADSRTPGARQKSRSRPPPARHNLFPHQPWYNINWTNMSRLFLHGNQLLRLTQEHSSSLLSSRSPNRSVSFHWICSHRLHASAFIFSVNILFIRVGSSSPCTLVGPTQPTLPHSLHSYPFLLYRSPWWSRIVAILGPAGLLLGRRVAGGPFRA